VRFRRASAVADAVRESVRATLAAEGFLRGGDESGVEGRAGASGESGHAEGSRVDSAGAGPHGYESAPSASFTNDAATATPFVSPDASPLAAARADYAATLEALGDSFARHTEEATRQESIEFGWTPTPDAANRADESPEQTGTPASARNAGPAPDAQAEHGGRQTKADAHARDEAARPDSTRVDANARPDSARGDAGVSARSDAGMRMRARESAVTGSALPPLDSAAGLVREAAAASLTPDIRPLGQLEDSFIIATDAEGLLLIDQHTAHERILFDDYRRLEDSRRPEAQQLLVPETFDLTPAQAAAFDEVADELERLGFSLMRLSGRTVAIRAVPAGLPASEARNLLAEVLDTVDAEKRGRARDTLRERIAASLASHAAIKVNTPLTHEKMRWLIDRLLLTSSPTTCPHGRPVILRLNRRDIERGFQRP
jgi:DNA mismatch repair ATPase MutL